MKPSSERWQVMTESQYEWERQALDWLREQLPDHDPFRAWSNFEFIAHDGSVNEVDVLVLGPQGFFLVEIKSWRGRIVAEPTSWNCTLEGRTSLRDNPLILTNRKARKLADYFRTSDAFRKSKTSVPYVEAVVFLSDPSVDFEARDQAHHRIFFRDGLQAKGGALRPAIVQDCLAAVDGCALQDRRVTRVDSGWARAIARAVKEAGIRRSHRYEVVGDNKLDGLLDEGHGWQDFLAHHVRHERTTRRIRCYTLNPREPKDVRATLQRAASREFSILHGIEHPGILHPFDFREEERGFCLLFDHDPAWLRLDQYLARHGDRMDVTRRLDFLRQLAEAIKHAHTHKLTHRALSPRSILVTNPDAPRPTLKIGDWQMASREPRPESTSGHPTATEHLERLVEDSATVYLAPELTSPTSESVVPELLDLFSLGAVAYHLFTGQPPAASVLDLKARLGADRSLQLSADVDGACEALRCLIASATCANSVDRMDTIEQFLTELDKVEDQLTSPDTDAVQDPAVAKANDRLPGGFIVTKRLGKGATAVVFQVERQGEQLVLKVALDPEHNDRIEQEAEVLDKLRHQNIVAFTAVHDVGDRKALQLSFAGDETLGQRLRRDGKLMLDFLPRFGEDLLEALSFLEDQGIHHRDIKPDNLGILPMGSNKQPHLVLFDFSLARTSPEEIRAGTKHYLEPFLVHRRPRRYDVAAERYATAVTLYEMATATLPGFGDPASDPALNDAEATIESDYFDPSIREPLRAFFEKALRRDPAQRHDNADEMLRAWRRVFEQAQSAAPAQPVLTEAEVLERVAAAALDSPLVDFGLSTRAQNALDRMNCATVEDLLRFPRTRLASLRGVGNKTRRELLDLITRLATAHPNVRQATTIPSEHPRTIHLTPQRSVDALADQLLGTSRGASKARHALSLLLGLDPGLPPWPCQRDVARHLNLNPANVSIPLKTARERWSKNPGLTELREEMAVLLDRHGAVMSTDEVAEAILATHGSVEEAPRRLHLARALVRAAHETEEKRLEPRWLLGRAASRTLLARTSPASPDAMLSYAAALGRVADDLAAADPLPSAPAVLESLRAVPLPPSADPLDAPRLARLAASSSQAAALSPRLELYPRNLPALRALKLSQGALSGTLQLTPATVRERVSSRYPDSEPLPPRPALDDLLRQAGLDLTFDAALDAYTYPAPSILSATSTSLNRSSIPEPPDLDEARRFEDRLSRSATDGTYLALSVAPALLDRARHELTTRFPVHELNFDQLFIDALHHEADAHHADWSVVLRADAAPQGSTDWTRLQTLVRRALARLTFDSPTTLLLTNPGLLARYDQLPFLSTLRDRLPGLWLLTCCDDQSELPLLDGHPLPVLTRAEWARIPPAWLTNKTQAATPLGGESG